MTDLDTAEEFLRAWVCGNYGTISTRECRAILAELGRLRRIEKAAGRAKKTMLCAMKFCDPDCPRTKFEVCDEAYRNLDAALLGEESR